MTSLGESYGHMTYARGVVYVQRRPYYARDGWHVMRVNARDRSGRGMESVIAVFASKRDAMAFAATKQPKTTAIDAHRARSK